MQVISSADRLCDIEVSGRRSMENGKRSIVKCKMVMTWLVDEIEGFVYKFSGNVSASRSSFCFSPNRRKQIQKPRGDHSKFIRGSLMLSGISSRWMRKGICFRRRRMLAVSWRSVRARPAMSQPPTTSSTVCEARGQSDRGVGRP